MEERKRNDIVKLLAAFYIALFIGFQLKQSKTPFMLPISIVLMVAGVAMTIYFYRKREKADVSQAL